MSDNELFYEQLVKAVGEQIQNVGKQLQKVGEQLQFADKQEKIDNLLEDKKHALSQTNVRHSFRSHRQINKSRNNKSRKCILALLIKSDRYQDLIHSLKDSKSNRLKPQDAFKLYGATQGLWIGTKSEFDKSQIKQKFEPHNRVTVTSEYSEYDVHFVKIELDEDDYRFHPDVNPMDRRDAFIELGKRSPQITVSSRLSCKAYENTEFYSR